MTLPASIANHVHVTELEIAHIWPDGQVDNRTAEDCVWTSGVELARLCHDPGIPATHVEAEHLRDDAGVHPLGGSSAQDLLRGLTRRYRWTPGIVAATDVWAALRPGWAVAGLGKMSAFPFGSSWRRFDPAFDGYHATLDVRTSGDDRVYWCDPLAPKGTYQGQWMPGIDFRRYINQGRLDSVIAPLRQLATGTEVIVQAPITDKTPLLIDVAAGTILYDLDGTTESTKSAGITARFSPYGAAGKRAVTATLNGETRLYLAVPSKKVAITDATPYSAAQLNAAKKAAAEAAIDAEQARIAQVLGLK